MYNCKIIAHRGANRIAPQNTLPAFEYALEMGIDGFETDVHTTKDGVPVICHNYTIDETSDGKGKISELTLDELKSYDFGSYFSDKYKGTKIPTLEEFFTLCTSAGKELSIINIELKPIVHNEEGIVAMTIDMAKRYGLFDKLLISSFERKLLLEAKTIDEKCKTAYLYPTMQRIKNQFNLPTAEIIKAAGVDAVHPMHAFVNAKYVQKMHSMGIRVNPWTVNSGEKLIKMLEAGVDSIITDMPDKANLYIKK